ncbi:hypothetical protein [Hyphomicrobium sp. 99]|uniref:hypothetical protein n=1 Tax=Hyphomicrobium sp. 99 TaxID=1163419 RepID=UPI0005F7AD14|nr:hypothetical protein [Hyphomicrobium sp. 99]
MRFGAIIRASLLICGAVILTGCNAPHSEEAEDRQDAPNALPPPVHTITLAASKEPVKIEGIATVLNPDVLLQLDADIRSATVAANFSHGQLERFKASTMLSRQTLENAARQEGIDASQLKLLLTRLQQSWGDKAPFVNAEARQTLMADIANGSRAVLRLDFPDMATDEPENVRVVPLRGGLETKVDTLWAAPSGNLAMPGVSFFGLINAGPGLRAGDRARVIADSPERLGGVVIPSAALVVYGSKSWCYVETEPRKYERKLVSLEAPVDDGYYVKGGFEPGERVVVKGASILLAREATPGSLDDDDDAGPQAPPPAAAPSGIGKSATPAVAQSHTAPTGDPD